MNVLWMGICGGKNAILSAPAAIHTREHTPARGNLPLPRQDSSESVRQARGLPLPVLPLSLAIIAKEFSNCENSGHSNDSAGARLTIAKRQMILEVHRRQIRVKELQNALAAERLICDDLICAIAIG